MITHLHLAPKLKKEHSYTSVSPLGLRDLFRGELDSVFLSFAARSKETRATHVPMSRGVRCTTVAITSTRASVFGYAVQRRMTQEAGTIYYPSKTVAERDARFVIIVLPTFCD